MQVILNLTERDMLNLLNGAESHGLSIEGYLTYLVSLDRDKGNVPENKSTIKSTIQSNSSSTPPVTAQSLSSLFSFTMPLRSTGTEANARTSSVPDASMLLSDTKKEAESIEDANEVVSEFDSEEDMKKSMGYLDGDFF